MRLKVLVLLLVTLPVSGALAGRQSGPSIATERIFAALAVRDGATICEIGAGDGELSLAAARLVGPAGRVYTSELGDGRVKTLRDTVAASGLAHVTVIEGDAAQTNFPDEACDALFMRNVYHHFADPAAMNASIRQSLKPGARLAIVDFTPPGREAGTPRERASDGVHGVSPDTLAREMREAGFEAVSSEKGDRRWFMVVVSKPRS